MFLKHAIIIVSYAMSSQCYFFSSETDTHCLHKPKGTSTNWTMENSLDIDFFVPANWNTLVDDNIMNILNITFNGTKTLLLKPDASISEISQNITILSTERVLVGWNTLVIVANPNESSLTVQDGQGNDWGEAADKIDYRREEIPTEDLRVEVKGLHSVVNCSSSEYKYFLTSDFCLRFPVLVQDNRTMTKIDFHFKNPQVIFGVVSYGKFEERNGIKNNETNYTSYSFDFSMGEESELLSHDQGLLEVYAFNAGQFLVKTFSNATGIPRVLLSEATIGFHQWSFFDCHFSIYFGIAASSLLLVCVAGLMVTSVLLYSCSFRPQETNKSEESGYPTAGTEGGAPSEGGGDDIDDYEIVNDLYTSFEMRKKSLALSESQTCVPMSVLKPEAIAESDYYEAYEPMSPAEATLQESTTQL